MLLRGAIYIYTHTHTHTNIYTHTHTHTHIYGFKGGDTDFPCSLKVEHSYETFSKLKRKAKKGFPGGSNNKESACNARATGLIYGGRSPGEREWLPTPVFLPGEFHGQRS